ncbi:MAG: hypothetical protein QM690_04730 [Sphingobium sp.]
MVNRAKDAARLGGDGASGEAGTGKDDQGCPEADENTEPVPPPPGPDRMTTAIAWLKARRAREMVFGSDLFSDPAWDMLLDLYVSLCRERAVSITDLCIASSAPMTTGLRWISILEHRGLIVRQADPSDRRRWNVSLTCAGVEKMEKTLDQATDGERQLGLGRLGMLD